ncbi:transcription factor btf3 [Culex quinquefasciatus]|uniref:Transcription factor btf3 n=1 Tax=Culex quinquefasciatus TaxID=7176 RepID=B0XDD4_CULQU|nr:transcription factor btf3 [Culex quinquefasciatus]|eukprot:XP_001867656.1 transcription factor btf3 [Culex quinquefasciatus]
MLSSIIARLDLKGLTQLEKLTNSAVAGDDDDVPELTKNTEKVFKKQAASAAEGAGDFSFIS